MLLAGRQRFGAAFFISFRAISYLQMPTRFLFWLEMLAKRAARVRQF